MNKTCQTCDNFNPHEKKPDGPGFCDVHKDWFLPVATCRYFKRVDGETMADFAEDDSQLDLNFKEDCE